MLDSSELDKCSVDVETMDPCPLEAIKGLTTDEAIQLLEIEIYMRHKLSKKLRNRLMLIYSENNNLQNCLDSLRAQRMCMDRLLKMCHTSCIYYNPSNGGW